MSTNSVFYRFKSQKEPSRISFDGTGISVWQLKHEIIMENKMGKGQDFDFAIYNADTEEEYTDDRQVVPRSTQVLARRLPPSRTNRGNGQYYMTTTASSNAAAGPSGSGGVWKASAMSKRFDGKEDRPSAPVDPSSIVLPADSTGDEASALAAMFQQTSQQWQQTQEQMASASHIPYNRASGGGGPRPARPAPSATPTPASTSAGAAGTPASGSAAAAGAAAATNGTATQKQRESWGYRDREGNVTHKAPPSGYICYRCGQKGHWIQECPTNDDRAYDDRPKIKRTTGIPKSFLTTVEGPGEPGSQGVMVTSEGGFVIAKPDSASWLAHRAVTKNLSASDVQNLAPTDPDLTCPICSKLLRDATLTPCCSTSFCEDCLLNSLAENDNLCPECEVRIKNVSKLVPDEGRRDRVKQYIEDVVESSKEVLEEGEEMEGENGAIKEEDEEQVKKEESPVVEAKQASATPAPISVEAQSQMFRQQHQAQMMMQQIGRAHV